MFLCCLICKRCRKNQINRKGVAEVEDLEILRINIILVYFSSLLVINLGEIGCVYINFLLYTGHDDRVPRNDRGSYLGNRPRVSFKTQARPTRDVPRSLTLACLDEDVQMATSSNNNNNNSRQVIITGRNRRTQRGRNSPVPHRRYRSSLAPRSKRFPIGEINWYKVTVSISGHKF